MNNEIIVALITGGLSVLGVVITNVNQSRKMQSDMKSELEKQQAVTDTKLDELTREVRQHNNFAQRIPVLEHGLKVADHRLQDIENKLNQ